MMARSCTWRLLVGSIVMAVASTTHAWTVSLEFRPAGQTVDMGDTVGIGLYAVSDDASDHPLSALDLVFAWDPTYLGLLGLSQTGASDDVGSSFFPEDDIFGLNEVVPPQDGDGLYILFSDFAPGQDSPLLATPAGILLTTFEFSALAETSETVVGMLASGGNNPYRDTAVWDGTQGVANHDVLGGIGSAAVEIVPEPASIAILAVGSAMVWLRRRR